MFGTEQSEEEPDFQRDESQVSPTFHQREKMFVISPSKNLSKIVEEEEVEMTNVTQNKTTFIEENDNENSRMQFIDFVTD